MNVRRVGDEVLEFGVSGMLWKDAFVMFDRKTQSLWSHVTGECLEGEYRGKRLAQLEPLLLPFAEWAERYPDSRVLLRPAGSEAASGYEGYVASSRQGIFGTQAKRNELPPKAIVQGVAHGDEAMAVAHEALQDAGRVAFRLAGRDFVARWEDGGARVFRVDERGVLAPHPSTSAYWFAWLNFHPRSEVVRSRPEAER